MIIRFQNSAKEVSAMDTEGLRNSFLFQQLFNDNEINLLYTHYDRMIIGGIKPVYKAVSLSNPPELKAEYFLQRREAGIINVGGCRTIMADDTGYHANKLDCVYLGKETKNVIFSSNNPADPALFYFYRRPRINNILIQKRTKEEAAPVKLGEISSSNKRTIYKYIHNDGIQSCQLVMGLTILEGGNVWNSVPPHTHTRRMEAYFYFDLPSQQRVFHFMGEPHQLRNLVVANHEAVISLRGRFILVVVLLIMGLYGEWQVRIKNLLIWMACPLLNYYSEIRS